MDRADRRRFLVNLSRIRESVKSLEMLLATDESSQYLALIRGHFTEVLNASREGVYGIDRLSSPDETMRG